MQDAKRKGRISRGRAHAMTVSGDRAPNAKLAWPQVRLIRLALAHGAKPRELAAAYGVDVSSIRGIRRHHTWKEPSGLI